MRTRAIFWKQNKDFFSTVCHDTKCLKNVCHFYIRNTRSGLNKSPEERTHNEIEVLHYVFTGIQLANRKHDEARRSLIAEAAAAGGLRAYEHIRKAIKQPDPIAYPTRTKWFLNYSTLDAIFRYTNNPAYRRMYSQIAQNAVRKAVTEWLTTFADFAAWRKNPAKFNGRPHEPHYIKEYESTAWLSNQTAELHVASDGKGFISIKSADVVIPVGKLTGKYLKTEIKPCYGGYRVLVTTDDEAKDIPVPKNPKRIMGIDTGVDNLAAVANNYGESPFLIKGKTVKAANQWYNKRRAKLMSALTKGSDSTKSKKDSKALDALSRKRDDILRDFFYKAAWYIVRKAVSGKAEVIVIGHNKGQKDGIDMGHKNNQSFVSIPHTKFVSAIKQVAYQCGIAFVEREESYTSKASVLDMDEIPVYSADDKEKHVFSGKRVHRGLYKSKAGILINADVNGAANILRKEYPKAFKGAKDLSYLYATTVAVGYHELYPVCAKPSAKEAARKAKERAKRPGVTSRANTHYRWDKKISAMDAFGVTRAAQRPAA